MNSLKGTVDPELDGAICNNRSVNQGPCSTYIPSPPTGHFGPKIFNFSCSAGLSVSKRASDNRIGIVTCFVLREDSVGILDKLRENPRVKRSLKCGKIPEDPCL